MCGGGGASNSSESKGGRGRGGFGAGNRTKKQATEIKERQERDGTGSSIIRTPKGKVEQAFSEALAGFVGNTLGGAVGGPVAGPALGLGASAALKRLARENNFIDRDSKTGELINKPDKGGSGEKAGDRSRKLLAGSGKKKSKKLTTTAAPRSAAKGSGRSGTVIAGKAIAEDKLKTKLGQ